MADSVGGGEVITGTQRFMLQKYLVDLSIYQ